MDLNQLDQAWIAAHAPGAILVLAPGRRGLPDGPGDGRAGHGRAV